jgi:hypothetical protein
VSQQRERAEALLERFSQLIAGEERDAAAEVWNEYLALMKQILASEEETRVEESRLDMQGKPVKHRSRRPVPAEGD